MPIRHFTYGFAAFGPKKVNKSVFSRVQIGVPARRGIPTKAQTPIPALSGFLPVCQSEGLVDAVSAARYSVPQPIGVQNLWQMEGWKVAELKRISPGATKEALEKALRYRLLNEPLQAESICRDVLEVDSENRNALVTLLLALTDQFETQFSGGIAEAESVLERITGDFEKPYYSGIVRERWGMAQLARGLPADSAQHWIREAMRCYEQAESHSDSDNPDAILRWNTCVRILAKQPSMSGLVDAATMRDDSVFGDEVPPR